MEVNLFRYWKRDWIDPADCDAVLEELEVETVIFRAVHTTFGSGSNLHKSMAERDSP